MLSINLPSSLEKHFWDIVRDSYDGDAKIAIRTLLKLHEKYGWKEQLLNDVKSVRSKIRTQGGISSKSIDDAVQKYRKALK